MIFRLNINYEDHRIQRSFNVKDTDLVKDVSAVVSENIPENDSRKYGLFLADKADPSKGLWLDPARHVGYYQMITQDTTLIYKRKFILITIRTLDGTRKKMELDESKTVGELMLEICSKMGIVNFEEYSLVKDSPTFEEKTGTLMKTGTLSRGATSGGWNDRADMVAGSTMTLSKDSKMEKLRKNLKTDDTICWLNHAQTLREQGLYKDFDLQPLVLRRKFFLSDRNVDTRDPVQLTLLYAQCVDGITSGRYPVTQKEATMLAALQLYVERGVDIKSNEIHDQVNWDDYLPKEYKNKGLDREIYERYRELGEIVQADARLKYVQTCRQLRTYGIAIFLAKEKHEEKRKLRPVLLGITRDAVVRIKPKNREVLQEWPLTKIKQWEVRSNVFTLDFGEYGRPYSVQTQEGEQIARLLAGYAEIISKKKQGVEYSPTSTLQREPHAPQVDHIQPQRATILTPNELAATLRRLKPSGHSGADVQNGLDSFDGVQNQDSVSQTPTSIPLEPPPPTPISPAQQALSLKFNSGMTTMDEAQLCLTDAESVKQHPSTTDLADHGRRQAIIAEYRKNMVTRLSEMSAATASIMTTTFTAASDGQSPDEHHYAQVAQAVDAISREMPSLCGDIRGLVLYVGDFDGNNADDNRSNLLMAAKRLAAAFNDMFHAAHPTNVEPRQQLLTAATRVGEAADVLKSASGVTVSPDGKLYQERLLALAKSVANATAQLVLRAKAVANRCEAVSNQNAVIQAATQCALATSQLVAVTKVVIASAAESTGCQQQLANVGSQVGASVERLAEMAPRLCPEERLVIDMAQSAHQVSLSLQDFLAHIHGQQLIKQHQEEHLPPPQTLEDLQSAVIRASERIISQANGDNSGDSRETARCAGSLAQSASHLIAALRGIVADESDDHQKQRLLTAARQLAEATTRLVASAKSYAEQQNTDSSRQQILEKAGEIREMVLQLSAEPEPEQILSNLSPEEQALDDAIADGLDQFGAASRSLVEPIPLLRQTENHDERHWADLKSKALLQLSERISAMSAAAAQAVSASAVAYANIAGVADVSSPAIVECAVVTDAVVAIAMHAQPLADDARGFAAALDTEQGKETIVSMTKTLVDSFSDLFLAARPFGVDGSTSQTPDERRQKLWAAASVVGQAGGELTCSINGPYGEEEKAFQEQVLSLARAVSSATAKLVLSAKGASSHCDTDTSRNAIIQSATQSALAASQLVAVTRVVLPQLMSDVRCREQLIRSCGAVGVVAERLVQTTEKQCIDSACVSGIQEAAAVVGRSVSDLVRYISSPIVTAHHAGEIKPTNRRDSLEIGFQKQSSSSLPLVPPQVEEKETVVVQIEHVVHTTSPPVPPAVAPKPKPPPPPPKKPTPTSAVIAASERILHADSSNDVAAEANTLAHMTSLLIAAIKEKANFETDEAQRGRLMDAAKQLAAATTRMLEVASTAPQSGQEASSLQTSVKETAEVIRQIAVQTGPIHAVDRGSEKVVIAPRVHEFKAQNEPAIEECQIALQRLLLLRSEIPKELQTAQQMDIDIASSHQQALNDARSLGDAVAQVSVHAKEFNITAFVEAVRAFSGSLAGLCKTSIQAFAALHSSSSSNARLDPAALAASIDNLLQARALIQEACSPLSIIAGQALIPSHDELVNIASRVARQTKSICDTCKTAVGRSSDVTIRRRYVELAKEVATATTQLVQAIKDQQPELGPPDIVKLNNAASPLLVSVDALVEFVRAAATMQQEFNPEKRQEDFLLNINSTLDVGGRMLETAKALISHTDPHDTAPYQAYSSLSTQFSSCIKNVLGALRTENLEQTSMLSSPPPLTPVQKIENTSQPRPQAPPPPPRPANLTAKSIVGSSAEEEASERLVQTAERELMTAAKQISAVTRRLTEMQPSRRQSNAMGNLEDVPITTVQFHEQIIEACRALASVTQALVRSASEAQRELMAQGRMVPSGRNQLYAADDSQWSQGLISAAKLVAEATQNLCEAADQLLRGVCSEEKVIAAARQVASCTTQLVLACRVKADPNSNTYNRLQAAGQAVKGATEDLVATVQRLISGSNVDNDGMAEDLSGRTRVGGLTQIINMHEEVMRRERELEEARRRLAKIYKEQYNRQGASGGQNGVSFLPAESFDSATSGGSSATPY